MDPPEDRCGYVLEPERLVERGTVAADATWPFDMPEDDWYGGFGLSCCWREVWGGTDRCIWHAEGRRKTSAALAAARTEHSEALDGAELGADVLDAPLDDAVSFEDCRLIGADLSGTKLRGSTFSGAYLRFADLSGATLSGASLAGANVGDANFAGATLRRVELWEAYLSNADLTDADLRDTDLSGIDLERVRLHGVDLKSVDLSRATLVGADLSGAYLRGSDLSGLDLERATLVGARLEKADLSGARLRNADLSGEAKLERTDLSGADLRYANLSEARLWRADLSEAELDDANLSGARLVEADLSDATLRNTVINGANMNAAVLSGATLVNGMLRGTSLEVADLSGTTIAQMDVSNANFTKVTVSEETAFREITRADRAVFDDVDFRAVSLRHANFGGARFCRTDFTGADLFNADLSRSDLSGAILDGANCRFARFDDANLGGASAIEADLRSAALDGANVYGTTLTGSSLNAETTITAVYTYPIDDADRPDSVPFPRLCAPPAPGITRDGSPAERDGADERTDGSGVGESRTPTTAEWYGRAASTHESIHRHLIRAGRVREAIRERHYLHEQTALIGRAWVERRYVDLCNLLVTRELIRVSESPVALGIAVLVTTLGFAVAYAVGGDLQHSATGVALRADGMTLRDGLAMFLFSLVTFLEGAYTIVAGSLGKIVSLDVFEPVGGLLRQASGVDGLEPIGVARDITTVERATGALLLVPFTLLLVQRLTLYIGTAVNEDGIGGGLLSWLLGK